MSIRGERSGKSKAIKEDDVPKRAPIPDLTLGDLKLKLLKDFNRTRSRLELFLAQSELYITFNGYKFKTETQQVLQIITMLKGVAFNQISPFLVNYIKYKSKDRLCTQGIIKETILYFYTIKGFSNGIRQVFRDIEEEVISKHNLAWLRQKGVAAIYAINFQQLATRTKQGKATLQYQFYIRLKDAVKDKIVRSNKPNNL